MEEYIMATGGVKFEDSYQGVHPLFSPCSFRSVWLTPDFNSVCGSVRILFILEDACPRYKFWMSRSSWGMCAYKDTRFLVIYSSSPQTFGSRRRCTLVSRLLDVESRGLGKSFRCDCMCFVGPKYPWCICRAGVVLLVSCMISPGTPEHLVWIAWRSYFRIL